MISSALHAGAQDSATAPLRQMGERVASLLRIRPIRWLLGLVATLAASAIAGPDANWDLLNYHYYNGRALVTGSIAADVAPAGLQTYLHPLIDGPIYLFIEAFGSRHGLVLWAGVLQWCCFVPVWRLTGAVAQLAVGPVRRVVAFVVAITGSGAASLAFTTFGDWIVAALVCEALARAIRVVGGPTGPSGWSLRSLSADGMARAGVFIGLAMTVKLTSVAFALALAAAVLTTAGLVATWRLTIGALASFAVLAGPWMVYLWLRFESPVFPFYNGLFRASSAPESNFDDSRYGAVSAFDVVRFPIDTYRGSTRYSELVLRDWRFAVLCLAVGVAGIVARRAELDRWIRSATIRLAGIFIVVGYVAWIVLFGIHRYFLPGEIAVSIALVAIASRVLASQLRLTIVAAAWLPLALSYQVLPAWGRGAVFDQPQLAAAIDTLGEPPAHVVFGAPPPLSFLASSFPASTRFASLYGFASGELRYAGPLEADLRAFVRTGLADGDLVIVLDGGATAAPPPLEALAISDCATFTSIDRSLQLCRLQGTFS